MSRVAVMTEGRTGGPGRVVTARPGRPGRAWVWWWGCVGVVLLLLAATAVLRVANLGTAVDTWWLGSLGMTAGLGLVGALVARRLPANPIGWWMLVGAIGQGLTGAGREYAVHAVVVDPGALPGPAWAAWFASWGSIVGLTTLPVCLLLFPDGRTLSALWRAVLVGVLVAAGGAVLTAMISPGEFTDDLPGFVNPLGVDRPWVEPASAASFVALQVGTLAAYAGLLRRWAIAGPARARLGWVPLTAGALVVDSVAEGSPLGDWPVFEWLAPTLLVVFIASIGLAVLRRHLWDIDVVVNVSLVYAILTAALGATFVAVVALTGLLHDGQSLLWPSVLALGVVALGFLPLRRGVQQTVDRILYGRRMNPDRVLAGLGERLADPDQPDQALIEAVEAIAAAHLRLEYVGLRTADSATVVSTGRARTSMVQIPLVYQGVQVGELELAARPGARLPRPHDLLGTTIESLSAVVHAVTVTRAVRDARQALLAAREEERRRLRRDLHDGLGPALAAIAMQADAAALLVGTEPTRSQDLMTGVAHDVRETIDDVRRLVYDLQPPVLDAVGLAAAVRERAVAFSAGPEGAPGLRVEVDAPTTLGELPAAVEVAAYRIVCEALTNVARHAGARRAVVTLARSEPGGVRLVVEDDGTGLGPQGSARPGVGMLSMVGRAGELGGTCRVVSGSTGGTRVEAWLPITGGRGG